MKYVILEKGRHDVDWYIEDSLEDVKEFFENRSNFQNFRVFELGKEIKIQLNEVPFKGLTNE